MLRGFPPPRRVCRALLLMPKFDLLHRVVGALGAVASIRWEAGRLSLDVGPWGPGQALVGVDPWDSGVSGVRWRGPGRFLPRCPVERVLKARQWRGVLWGLRATPECERHFEKSHADLSGMGGEWGSGVVYLYRVIFEFDARVFGGGGRVENRRRIVPDALGHFKSGRGERIGGG